MRKISQLTVLLAMPNKQVAEGIANALRTAGCKTVKHTEDSKETLAAMSVRQSYDMFFLAQDLEPHGGIDFSRFIRLTNTPMSKSDVILHLTGNVTRDKVISAINAGVSAVMIGDITGASVIKQMEQVINNPKDYIEGDTYTGPDRRRVSPPPFKGVERRKS